LKFSWVHIFLGHPVHENLIEKENHQTRSWSVFHFSAKIFPQKCGISEAITLNVDI